MMISFFISMNLFCVISLSGFAIDNDLDAFVDLSKIDNNLIKAENYAYSNKKILRISQPLILKDNLKIRCPVVIEPGGKIICPDSKKIILDFSDVPFKADRYQVFEGFPPGTVMGLKVAFPEWWHSNQHSYADAINCAIQSGGKVFLGPKLYDLSSSITIVPNMKLEGSGFDTELRMSDVKRSHLISNRAVSNVEISKIRFTFAGDSNAHMIYFRNDIERSTNIRIFGCWFMATGGGQEFGITINFSDNVVISDNWFENLSRSAVTIGGSSLAGSVGQLVVRNNTFKACATKFDVGRGALNPQSKDYTGSVLILGNQFYDCGDPKSSLNHAIYVSKLNRAIISNNIFFNSLGGYAISSSAKHSIVNSNIIDSAYGGIDVGYYGDNLLDGTAAINSNLFSNIKHTGIRIQHSNTTVGGNSFYKVNRDHSSGIYDNSPIRTYGGIVNINIYNNIVEGEPVPNTAPTLLTLDGNIKSKSIASNIMVHGNTVRGVTHGLVGLGYSANKGISGVNGLVISNNSLTSLTNGHAMTLLYDESPANHIISGFVCKNNTIFTSATSSVPVKLTNNPKIENSIMTDNQVLQSVAGY